jgi:predicted RNA-binding protein (virulence factor B family)
MLSTLLKLLSKVLNTRKLLARGFIRECGKEDTIGKPNLYKTTNEFLDYFVEKLFKHYPLYEKLAEEIKDSKEKFLELQLDEKTNRLIASEKYDLLKKIRNLEKNDEVEIILYSKTPLGYKVIVNNRYEGMIFHSEVFENLKIGDKKRAYVKNVREDNKLDISLQKIGQKIVDDKVFEVLEKNGGKLNFTYKSEAEDIKEVFGISKKSFKASLTKLLSENKIILEENCIRIK